MKDKIINNVEKKKVDWMITLVPLAFILLLCILFIVKPDLPKAVLGKIRFLLGDTFGVYYLVIGLGIFLISIYVAF